MAKAPRKKRRKTDPRRRAADRKGRRVKTSAETARDRLRRAASAGGLAHALEQSGLPIGEKDDRFEREADQKAMAPMPPQARVPAEGPVAPRQPARGHAGVEAAGGSEPLSPAMKKALEAKVGADLSGVRVHRGPEAHKTAAALGARAFTVQNHIWLGKGQSPQDTPLMAHEAAHVVQQGGAAPTTAKAPAPPRAPAIQRKPDDDAAMEAPSKSEVSEVAPGVVELKGKPGFQPGPATKTWLDESEDGGRVAVRFGEMAAGTIDVEKGGEGGVYHIKKQGVPVKTHPLFDKLARSTGARPVLYLAMRKGKLTGHVGLQQGKENAGARDLARRIQGATDVLGLPGFSIPKMPALKNELVEGAIAVEVADIPIKLGRVLDGTFTIKVADGTLKTFQGSVAVMVGGLAEGEIELAQNENGELTGETALAVTFPQGNVNGSLTVTWDGTAVTGKNTVNYKGEKMSGSVTLHLMEKSRALAKAKAVKAGEAASESEEKPTKRGEGLDAQLRYVLFGEGDLDFNFTDWLSGTAKVAIDPEGHTTIVGEITPEREVELFPQKRYGKELFKLGARARYGIPVVGNVFLFAEASMSVHASVGPGTFKDIAIKGRYSTDPAESQNFSIQGTLGVEADAKGVLNAEAGAGAELLGHDFKAGASLLGVAGAKARGEATPVIGYREKAADGKDKKGEFFIRGDFDVAAQPYLGLQGSLFVEIDAPWWSPVPDKNWIWPLFGKEYPLGDPIGMGMSMDYVFGSGEAPQIDFKAPKFDLERFIGDIYEKKTSSGGKKDKPYRATWKERNERTALAPRRGEQKGGAAQKALSPPTLGQPKVAPGGVRRKVKPAVADARTASGKTVREYQREAERKGKKPEPSVGAAERTAAKSAGQREERKAADARKEAAAAKVRRAMNAGIRRRELKSLLRHLKKEHRLKEARLDRQDDVHLRNSDELEILGEPQQIRVTKEGKKFVGKRAPAGSKSVGTFHAKSPSETTVREALEEQMDEYGFDKSAFPYPAIPEMAPRPEVVKASLENLAGLKKRDAAANKRTRAVGHMGNIAGQLKGGSTDQYEGGHLIGHQFGGPDTFENLTPQRGNAVNRGLFARIEGFVKDNLKETERAGGSVDLQVVPRYREEIVTVNSARVVKWLRREFGRRTWKRGGGDSYTITGTLPSGPLKDDKSIPPALRDALNVVLPKDLSRGATLHKRKEQFQVSDEAGKSVLLLSQHGRRIRVEPGAFGEEYFRAKGIDEDAPGEQVSFPSRIATSFEATVSVQGTKEVEGGPKNAKLHGAELQSGEPVATIVHEGTGKAKPGMERDAAAMKPTQPEVVRVMQKFTIKGN